MTITTNINNVSYIGDGVSVTFAIPFPFAAPGDIIVRIGGVVHNTGYSLGGTYLTFAVAPALGVAVSITRATALAQTLDLFANDSFPAEGMEAALDRLVMMVQDVSARLATAEARLATIPAFPIAVEGLYLRWSGGVLVNGAGPGAGVGSAFVRQSFAGTLGQTVFALASVPASILTVSVGGIVQPTSAYGLVGSTLTLTGALPAAMDVTVSYSV